MIVGLDHANIYTARLKETVAFYIDVLGLEDGPRPQFAGFNGAWLYGGGRPIVHLVEAAEERTPKGALDHFSFAVDDLEPMLKRLEAHNVPYRVTDIPGGFGRQAFVVDPNGVKVELTWRP